MTYVPFNRPGLLGNEVKYIRDAICRGQLSGDGHYTAKCSSLLCEITKSQKVLLTHSCTAALEMAAMLLKLKPGDEVIMPSFTFVSTANAVALRGATPVFVDVEPKTYNIDPEKLEQAITDRTRAVFAIHYAGIPADMDALGQIAREHGLALLEDAAQALGSTYKGRPCGSLGDLAAFSFHETKNIISGEGGALAVNKPNLVEAAEIIREKGTNRSKFFRGEVDKYTWVDLGSSYLPGELIAAFLFAQLEVTDMVRARRLANFEHYMMAFEPLSTNGRARLPFVPPDRTTNGHMFYLMLNDLEDRTRFITHMSDKGIVTPFHYVPLHSSPAGQRIGRIAGPMTVTDTVSETLVRLPMFFDLSSDIEVVIDAALEYFRPNAP